MFPQNLSYTKKKLVMNRIKALCFVIGFGLAIYYVFRWGINLFKSPELKRDLNTIFLFTIGFIWYPINTWIVSRLDESSASIGKNIQYAKRGAEGEDLLFRELRNLLGSDYYIKQNFILPGKSFDIDAVVIGPKGFILFEVKNYSNKLIFSKDRAFYVKEGDMDQQRFAIDEFKDPRAQVLKQSHSFARYLYSLGYKNVPVRKALVIVNKDLVTIEGDGSNIFGAYVVQGIGELKKFIDSLYIDERFTPAVCKKLNDILK